MRNIKNTLFSPQAIRMLEENEFDVKFDPPFLTFRKLLLSKAMLLIPAFFLTLIVVVHIQQHPLKTLIVILIVAVLSYGLWFHLTRKIHFQIDFSDNTFKFYDHKNNLHWSFLDKVDEILWKSRFVNDKHEISILLKMDDNHLFTIFQFQCDNPEPNPEILEVYFFIENTLKKIKPI